MTPLLLVISLLYFINISFSKSIFILAEFSVGPSLSNFILVRIDTYNEVKNYVNCVLSIQWRLSVIFMHKSIYIGS